MRITLLSLSMLLLVACGDPEPYKVGYVGGLSGRVADLGIAGRNGVTLAFEEQNAKGGVDGHRLLLEVRDDRQDAETAKAVVTELLDMGVEAVIGHMTSSMSVTTVPLINARQVVMISPTTTTRQLTGLDDFFFRVIRDTAEYGQRSAEYRVNKLGHRKVVAVYDERNAAYTESWLESFSDKLEKLGGQVVLRVPFVSSAELHFHDLADQVLAVEADSVQIIASALDAAQLIQQLNKKAPDLPIGTSEWSATEKLTELGGAAVEGVVTAQFIDRESKAPSYQRFKTAYMARFGSEPGFADVAGYDAAQVVIKSLAQRQRGESLKDTILRIGRFEGAQGAVGLDRFGDAERATYITEIKDGRFQRIQ